MENNYFTKKCINKNQDYLKDPFVIRNLVYGLQDSIISTSGFLVGVTFANFSPQSIIIATVILILVEAISMAFGAFVSDESFLITAKLRYDYKKILIYGFIMFISYVVGGLFMLLPYILKWNHNYIWTIFLAIVTLFTIYFNIQKNAIKAMKMSLFGFIILIISIYFGNFMPKQ
jgi:VIT1/CCC1 family predicted Fe2+/Mn2+ transporter